MTGPKSGTLETPAPYLAGPGVSHTSRRDHLTVAERSATMRKVKGRNTKPEMTLRRALWAAGMRYRLHCADLAGKPDVVFRSQKLAVFVDGEFWHGKKLSPERLAEMKPYWQQKIARNVERDKINNAALVRDGWKVVRAGESHVKRDLDGVLNVLADLLAGRKANSVPAGLEIHLPKND